MLNFKNGFVITFEKDNLQGRLILTQALNEQEAFDISGLSAGLYLLKARNPTTGETRNM
jgi:hypothetical protein